MLYFLLRPIVRLSLWLFYHRIHYDGLNCLDKSSRPLLILANHSVSFMDAFLLACLLRRKLQFFARGDAFINEVSNRWLRRLGLIPIYRKSEGTENFSRNNDSLNQAIQVFRQKGALLIFCEGSSDTQKQLKPLKKGPFRLAIDAATQLSEPPLIVPMGINYSAPVSFGGDVYLEMGAGIEPGLFLQENTDAGRAKAATALMRRVEASLRHLVWHVPKQSDLATADAAMNSLPLLNFECSFSQSKQILDAINSGGKAKCDMLGSLIHQLRNNQYSLPDYVLLILTAPMALSGFLFHALPLSCTAFLTKRFVHAEDFWAPVYLCIAIFILMIWYVLALVLMLILAPSWKWLLLLFAAAAFGIFFIKKYKPLLWQQTRTDRAISRLEGLKNE